jgi:hypothetical protein
VNTSEPRDGTLHVTKECSEYTGEAGSFCTIVSSNLDAIPVGSEVVYAEAATATGGLDTDIVVDTASGDTAYGHVVLDGVTQTGTVTLAGGIGQLAKLKADLVVAPLAEPSYSGGRAVLVLRTTSRDVRLLLRGQASSPHCYPAWPRSVVLPCFGRVEDERRHWSSA